MLRERGRFNGQVVGLQVLDGGSYFLGAIGLVFPPTDYESAKIDLDNGGNDAKIIWEEDTTTDLTSSQV